jgi:hypothetical protein
MFKAENFCPAQELSGWGAAACKSMYWKSRQRPAEALFAPVSHSVQLDGR